MSDFSLSHHTVRVRGLKSLDNSLHRNSKDFEKSKVGFDFSLRVFFSREELTDSLPPAEEGLAMRALTQGSVDALVAFVSSARSPFPLRDLCTGPSVMQWPHH